MTAAIREGKKEDAKAIIAFIKKIAEEPGILIGLYPGEFDYTVEQEERFIEEMAASENSVLLVAQSGEAIAGVLTMRGGSRKATRHSAVLGITVAKDFRGQGIGLALMQAAIDYARASGVIRRIELNVITKNLPAVRLYEKLGFSVEGQRRKALFRFGNFHDDYLMALLIDPQDPPR